MKNKPAAAIMELDHIILSSGLYNSKSKSRVIKLTLSEKINNEKKW